MTPQVLRADPAEVARLAKAVLDSTTGFANVSNEQSAQLTVSQAAFGNTSAAAGTFATVDAAMDATDTVIGRLIEVLEGDSDRLYRVAAASQRADEDAADQLHMHRTPGLQP